ncbi:ATP-dependent protease ClpP protease subunit [Dysgonomonas sp. PH5-45]|uniref:Clp protease ClpP n=1 Tax=unclassified Dysgonomonas TaxID=2630389 RepID=UPI00247340A7|nr:MULTISPECIES: Clp protease ClpP [unclassified Dysgonomonas]MDH6354495.1 ATP-dependent protease ClpP protease subunit [Dysgonomonas sp. PH5-45]MDH6387448.1 ATP-dependent protease ClpP protease subunit [Dysgonomonas sp. PH5-37]
MIEINGIIGNEKGEVSLLSVIEQVEKENAGGIHVKINSVGGDLDVGFSIYNYLKNLNREVTTECVENCASAASIIFLAGTRRIAGCPIMIHNPFVDGVSGDSADLRTIADWIEQKELQAEGIYAERTRLDRKTLSALMETESYISQTQAVAMGFATEAKHIAFARYNQSPDLLTHNKTKRKKMAKSFIAGLLGRRGSRSRVRSYMLDLTTVDGLTLFVDRTEGEPQIGDTAEPDGEFAMPDGRIIVVEGGVITDIVEASAEGDEKETAAPATGDQFSAIEAALQEALDEIQLLKEQLATAKALAKSQDDIRILNAVKIAGGAGKLLKGYRSVYKPSGRAGNNARMTYRKESLVSKKLAEEKEKRGFK